METYPNIILPGKSQRIENLLNNDFCKDFVSQLQKAENIETFSIMGNSYGEQFFLELAPYLQKIKTIKKVILNDIFTSRKDSILPSLKLLNASLQNKNITLLDISSNAICPDGCFLIKDILIKNPSIKYLYLNHTALARIGTVHICDALKKGGQNLKVFQATKNRIETEAVKIAAILRQMSELEELVIFQNNIRDEGMLELIRSLEECPKLRYLDIGDNLLKGESVDLLFKVLKGKKELKVLKISDCNVSQEDSHKFEEFFRDVEFDLEFFGFNYNEVDDLKGFCESLKVCKNLRKVEVKGTYMEEEEEECNEIREVLPGMDLLFESDFDDDIDLEVEQKGKMDKLLNEFLDMQITN